MKRSSPTKAPRDRILETAARLFYAEGIRAVGIDRIILEAEVAKMTFYNHFASKEALVVEVIKKRDQDWRAWFGERLQTLEKAGPLALFDAIEERLSRKDFRGCAFINTMVEAADADSAIHQAAQAHKEAVMGLIEAWLKGHGVEGDLPELAYRFMLLIDGAIVAAVRDGNPRSAAQARAIAGSLLEINSNRKRRNHA